MKKTIVKFIIWAAVAACSVAVFFCITYPHQALAFPDVNAFPAIYTVTSDGTVQTAVDTSLFSDKYATYENGYDSDPSPIKEVSVNDINAAAIPYTYEDFSSYAKKNSDVLGWFYFTGPASIAGLPISQPFVQTNDNEFYLSHGVDGRYNYSGSVYIDRRNDMSSIKNNKNIVIYAHARGDFGGLKYLDNAVRWQADANNHFITLATKTEVSLWQVFSWYETDMDYDYRKKLFTSDSAFVDYAEKLQAQNKIPRLKSFAFKPSDIIMTLSTCKGSNTRNRVAVHAVLIKCEKR